MFPFLAHPSKHSNGPTVYGVGSETPAEVYLIIEFQVLTGRERFVAWWGREDVEVEMEVGIAKGVN